MTGSAFASLPELLRHRATETGGRCILTFQRQQDGEVRMTAAMLDQRARSIAAALQSLC